MKLFWTIITKLYCNLLAYGFKLPKISWLFNKPVKSVSHQLTVYILADTNFTKKEQLHILYAANNINYFCNGMVEFEIDFKLDPNNLLDIENNNTLIKARLQHPTIEKAIQEHQRQICGLCYYQPNKNRTIFLVPENLYNSTIFQATTAHELLHAIWLQHTEKPSILYDTVAYNKLLFPTKIDAQELVRVWSTVIPIKIDQFRYFKMPN